MSPLTASIQVGLGPCQAIRKHSSAKEPNKQAKEPLVSRLCPKMKEVFIKQ